MVGGFKIICVVMALMFGIDLVSSALEDCSMAERGNLYYSRTASKSYGKFLKAFDDKNREECRQSCCHLNDCNFMMYTTVLRARRKSINSTCFLFKCEEVLKCKTKDLPKNVSGVSFIGIKQKDFNETNMTSSSTIGNIEEHKMYKRPSKSSIRASDMQLHSNIVMQNNKTISNNNQVNNSNVTRLSNTKKLQPKSLHSQIKPSHVPSNHFVSIHNTSYPLSTVMNPRMLINNNMYSFVSSSNPLISISNNHYSILSMISPSQSIDVPVISNISTHSNPSSTIHNTSHYTLSTFEHMHTLENRPRLNNSSSHVDGWLSGSQLNVNKPSRYQSHTVYKGSQSLNVSAGLLVNFSQSSAGSKILTSASHSVHYSLTYSSHSVTSEQAANVPHLHSSSSVLSVVYVSSVPTSHTSKSESKKRRKFSEPQSHTTPASLVISLIIGVVFFGSVLFLIGRRWSEQYFRRGYSRVDYLLNDYD